MEKWSRPIFDQYREQNPDELRRQREDEFAKARRRRQQKEAKAAPNVPAGMCDLQYARQSHMGSLSYIAPMSSYTTCIMSNLGCLECNLSPVLGKHARMLMFDLCFNDYP